MKTQPSKVVPNYLCSMTSLRNNLRLHRRSILPWVYSLGLSLALFQCAPQPSMSPAPKTQPEESIKKAAPSVKKESQFATPTPLESQLDAKPMSLPEVKPVPTASLTQTPSAGNANTNSSSAIPFAGKGGPWRIQAGALPDLESAQARKKILDQKLGGSFDLIFDPPHYKLRWGNFPTRQEAEDKLLELSDILGEAFVVRQ